MLKTMKKYYNDFEYIRDVIAFKAAFIIFACIDILITGCGHIPPQPPYKSLSPADRYRTLSENVPVSGISDILGHASTITTEIYLTTDETHLKELSLEVPANEG